MKKSKSKVRAKWASDAIEPILSDNYTKLDLAYALNWYNSMSDSKKMNKYILTYFKNNNINKIIPTHVQQQTAGAVARLIELGQSNTELENWMTKWTKQLEDKVPDQPSTKKVMTIQERTAIKLNEYITGLDNSFENFIESDYKMKFSTTNYLANSNVKGSYTKEIIKWVESVRGEYILSKTDKDMKEGYSNYTSTQKNKIIKFFDDMIDQIEKYALAVTPLRKKKVVLPSKIVSKLKYMKSFPELKLNSIKPEKLINAKEVWTYNTATRMLGYYTSQGGMTVSGTTLKGFDFTEQRRLRKPDIQLEGLLKTRNGQLIKKFNLMAKTVKTSGTGRFNNSTIILKVV